jgi:hypothetical protein
VINEYESGESVIHVGVDLDCKRSFREGRGAGEEGKENGLS